MEWYADSGGCLDGVRASTICDIVMLDRPEPDAGDDTVPAAVKRRRSQRLRRLSDAQGERHRAAKVGRRERGGPRG